MSSAARWGRGWSGRRFDETTRDSGQVALQGSDLRFSRKLRAIVALRGM